VNGWEYGKAALEKTLVSFVGGNLEKRQFKKALLFASFFFIWRYFLVLLQFSVFLKC
jgi:hypothetical protein